jgi:hypothetical protein
MRRVTAIKGLSEERRLPRIGKIHLGVKKVSKSSGNEYPAAVDYFVCPPEIVAIYGEQPRELEVLLPSDNLAEVFPTAYKFYRKGVGLWCTGNGETGYRVGAGEGGGIGECPCPCDFLNTTPAQCKQMANLMVIVPRVSIGGVYQIDTSSINSIIDIQSGIAYAKEILGGRVAMVPFTLRLSPREVTTPDGKKKVIHTMSIALASFGTMRDLRGKLDEVRSMAQGIPAGRLALPAPVAELGNGEVEEEDLVAESEQVAGASVHAEPVAGYVAGYVAGAGPIPKDEAPGEHDLVGAGVAAPAAPAPRPAAPATGPAKFTPPAPAGGNGNGNGNGSKRRLF